MTSLLGASRKKQALHVERITNHQLEEFLHIKFVPLGTPEIGNHYLYKGRNDDLGEFFVLEDTGWDWILISERPYVRFIGDGAAPTPEPTSIGTAWGEKEWKVLSEHAERANAGKIKQAS